jgi:glutathione synthase/RimK-type ligase-like ATP-grasp enzyme
MSDIGILLDDNVYKGIPFGRTGFERLTLYNRAAKRLNHTPFYLSLRKINIKSRKATGYVPQGGSYRLVTHEIPAVIHNRCMPFSLVEIKKLSSLKKQVIVFNGKTRYNKDWIHELLLESAEIKPHLPTTAPFNHHTLNSFAKKFPTLYIKPVNSSIGRGIIKISKMDSSHWKITTLQRKWVVSQSHLYPSLRKQIGTKTYLIQQGIMLAKYNGNPFDLRVSVQRNGEGQWQITGIAGKVACKGSHVTNVAQGGHVVPYEKLLSSCDFSIPEVKLAIERLSLQIARFLGKRLSLVDLGLDIGLDELGKPYFIEMNGRDLRYSFKKANLLTEWYKTYENPILYADYLLKEKVKK